MQTLQPQQQYDVHNVQCSKVHVQASLALNLTITITTLPRSAKQIRHRTADKTAVNQASGVCVHKTTLRDVSICCARTRMYRAKQVAVAKHTL